METTLLSTCIGSYLIIISISSIVLNLNVLYVLYKGKFLSANNSPVYLLAFANICGNLIQATIYAFYLGPSCILQDFLFPGGKNNFFSGFMGFLIHGQWFQDLFIHDVTSFNRLITVVYPKATFLFSRKLTVIISILTYFLGFSTAWFANYYLPCCKFYLYYGSYSYTFLDTGYNVANIFVNTPLNFITSGFAVVNYVIIFIFVHLSNQKMNNAMDQSIQKNRKNQEIKYAIQFSLCTVCCIAAWKSYFVPSNMATTPLFICLGFFLIIICVAALILNLAVLYVLYKGKFLASGQSSIYIFAFANICGNVLMLIIYGFYFGPSCILQDFLFPGGKDNFFPAFLTYLVHGQWNQDLLIHDATSFNRLIMVVYPRAGFLFTRKTTIGIIIFIYVFGYFASWFGSYYLPCCKFYLYYGTFSYALLDTGDNVANTFIFTPINFIGSGIAVVNYVIIYIFVHVSNQKVINIVNKSIQKSRKTQEIKYAIQFALCTVCCIATWVSCRVFPLIGILPSPVYLILTTFLVFHASTNSIVFLVFNKEIREVFKLLFLKQKSKKNDTSIKLFRSRTNDHTPPKVTAY